MKKSIFFLSALLATVFGCIALTSCGDDDENETNAKVKSVTIYVTVEPTDDFLKYADLKLVYTDNYGSQKEGAVSAGSKKYSITIDKAPIQGKISYACTAKSGAPTPGEYDKIKTNSYMRYEIVKNYSDGSQKTAKSSSVGGNITLTKDNLADYISKHPNISYMTFSLDKDFMLKQITEE